MSNDAPEAGETDKNPGFEAGKDIPQVLREYPQWVTCDKTDYADERGRPHWKGDKGERGGDFSWSDPDYWHTFEEAVEAAAGNEDWGFGFVFLADNEAAADLSFLDLDGCLEEPRDITSLKDWVPDGVSVLIENAWAEYSAGEHGIHIPFKGDTPDWWSNDTDEHEGPEAHESKFCAFTGDTIEGSDTANGVFEGDIDPFLLNAYRNWRSEWPELPNFTDTFDVEADEEDEEHEEWLTNDDIEDALGYLDADMQMEEWWNVGRAIQDYDDGPDGKELYREWSKTGTKWDDQAPDLLDWLWTSSTPGTKIQLGTLIHLARKEGWELPPPPGVGDSWPDDDEDFIQTNDGGYGYWYDASTEDEKTNWQFAHETNFLLDVNAFLSRDEETYFDIDVLSSTGEEYRVQVLPTAFNEKRDFKREIVTGTSTVARPRRSAEAFLNDLRQHLDAQDAPELIGVKRFGFHDDEFVTAEGALNADGWAEQAEHVLIDDGNPLVDVLDLAEEADKDAARRALELLPQTRDPELFIPVIGWFYATAFRPTILDEAGQFNHLAIFGETGAGKTMTTSALSQMFGMGTNGFNPLETAFVSLRTLSAGRGLPIWYDEYKPAEWSEYDRRRFHGDLRKAAAGQWARRGNSDKSVDGYFLSAPVVLTGEQHLQGSAEQRRTIQTQFSVDATLDPDCQRAYYELRDECDLRGHARLFYQWALSQDNDVVRMAWELAGQRVAQKLDIDGVDDMAAQGLQTVLFGMTMYQLFADEMDAELPELPLWGSLERLAEETGSDARTSHIEEFIELVGRAAVNDYLVEDVHYTVVNSTELRLNVSRSHDRVSKFIQDHGLTGVDIFDKASDYNARFREANDEWITCVGQKSPPVSRAVGIDLDVCEELDRGMFTEGVTPEDAEDEESTAIKELGGGYATITARVNDVERPTAESAPIQAGRLVDETGPVNFVCWGDTPFDLAPDEHYRFENVDVGEYDGGTQVELVDGLTIVEPIATDETDGGSDGDGEPPQGERLSIAREAIGDLEEDGDGGALHADIVNALLDEGVSESSAEDALDKLSQRRVIYQPADGELGEYRLMD